MLGGLGTAGLAEFRGVCPRNNFGTLSVPAATKIIAYQVLGCDQTMANLELEAVPAKGRNQVSKLRLFKVRGGQAFRKISSALAVAALTVFGCLSLSACGGGSSSTTISSVSISAASTTVPVNGQDNITATVNLTNSSTSTTTTVSWEVNGVAGGSAACGTIAPSSTDQLVGIYTAPPTVPTSSCGSTAQLGEVAVTAVASQTSSSSSTGSVTSNTVILTIGSGLGLSLSPSSVIVPAGGNSQFSALLNGVSTAASWTLSSTSGEAGNLGTIDATGLYTAPAYPPPGASVTITATVAEAGGNVNAMATATIVYSDHSLDGPYAFSYTGNDTAGFLAVAGSFVTDGNGKIISGVEDVQSSLTGVSAALPIDGTRSTYSVGSDGRGTASVTTSRGTDAWSFVLSTNQHAEMIRFNTNDSGGGAIDQQSLNGLTNSTSVISGRYAFALLGVDASFDPLGMAGEFSADGSGNFPNTNAILDVNDNGISGGTVTRRDTTLAGSYAFDPANPDTGRGTIVLQSATTGTGKNARTFAFYTVGTATNSSNAIVVSQFHLVEIDGAASVAGDMFLASTNPGLASANYVITAGGESSAGAYASGGVFASDGVSTTSNGVLDINNAGAYNKGPSLTSCSFTTDATTGRVDLTLCPSGFSADEFAAYPTAVGTVLMLELDTSAVATGWAYQQCGPQSAGCAAASPSLTAASVGLGLDGQGLFHNPPATAASYQPDLDGEAQLSGLSITGGNLDINNFGAVFQADPLGSTGSSIASPASNGRGTATLAPTNPTATYDLVYYLIDDNTALLLSSSQSPVAIGRVARQF